MRIPEEWFGGNFAGVELLMRLGQIAHAYDDIIDGDPITPDRVHDMMYNVLIDLPNNELYRKYQAIIVPLWELTLMAYRSANIMEKTKDEHSLEISHSLRYAAGHIIALVMIGECGREKALEYMPEMWRYVVFERFNDYRLEHLEGG